MATTDDGGNTTIPIMQGDTAENEPATIREAYHDMKNAHTLDEKAKMFNVIYGIICTSCIITVFLTLLNLLPLYILIVGSIYLYDCPLQRHIPIYMIVEGVFFLIRTSIFWLHRWYSKKKNPEATFESTAKPAPLNTLINLFLFVWLICGSVWVFGNYPTFENPHSQQYCHKLAYISAYVYLILQWIAFPIGLLIGCCILVTAGIAHRAQKKEFPLF